MDLALAQAATSHQTFVLSVAASCWGSLPGNVSRTIPPGISRDQAYYWTAAWQAGIDTSRQQLADGEFREFDNGRDLARWLLSEDE